MGNVPEQLWLSALQHSSRTLLIKQIIRCWQLSTHTAPEVPHTPVEGTALAALSPAQGVRGALVGLCWAVIPAEMEREKVGRSL